MHKIVSYTLVDVCEKICQFLSSIKKMHTTQTKTGSFFGLMVTQAAVLMCAADMKRVHLSVQLYHQSAADCIMKIIAEHIPEVCQSSSVSCCRISLAACIGRNMHYLYNALRVSLV